MAEGLGIFGVHPHQGPSNVVGRRSPPVLHQGHRPKRKPNLLQRRIGEFMRASAGKFPLTEIGDTLGSPGDRVKLTNITYVDEEEGTETVGAFIPKVDPVTMPGLTRLLKRLGREDLMTNLINITMSDTLTPDKFEQVTRHEFRHSGIAKLKGETGQFALDLPRLEFPSSLDAGGTLTPTPSPFTEEDFVRLLDVSTDIQKFEKVENFFHKLRTPRIPMPLKDILQDPAVVMALVSLQKQGDAFAQSKGQPPSLQHFPSDEDISLGIAEGAFR